MQTAFQIGCRALPLYSHPCSPKTYTQPQLFACLVLKTFLDLDYRGTEALLRDCKSLREIINLRDVPDHSTLHKACKRLLKAPHANRLLDESLKAARKLGLLPRSSQLAAIDASGFEAHRVSHYFVRRRARGGKTSGKWHTTTYRRFPKLAALADCASHLIVAAVPHRGPSPDFGHWDRAMHDATQRVRIQTLLADAGYDAEWVHQAARLVYCTRTIIPPEHGRPTHKLPRGYYRRRMATHFNSKKYGQRAQVETVFSMIKRRLGSAVNAHTYWSQCRALMLKALTHNLMIVRHWHVFDRAHSPHKRTGYPLLSVQIAEEAPL